MKHQLLYIDDDKFRSMSMIDNLRPSCVTTFARSTSEAMVFLNDAKVRGKFDCVVLDVMMRLGDLQKREEDKQTGWVLHRIIRKLLPRIPIVVLSALSEENRSDEMEVDQRLVWLRKPVAYEELRDTIEDAIAGAQRR